MEYTERKRLLFLGLPWTFTVYTITDEMLNIRRGLLKVIEDDCYMYKVQDVKLEATLIERIFKLGTVVCYTGDATHMELRLTHIRRSKEIKNYILEASEKARIKRRTLHTLDIGDGNGVDGDEY
ncbi:MAG: PH domain-containing protein [Lachnospiraceae bacterium]|nr:PH domain-containing protein [Lachnospiraceae bacterium]